MANVQVRRQQITPLIEAVQKQEVDRVRARIEAGDNINATDSYRQTALHWATKYKSVEIVELLVDAGADPNARDEDGDTPLGNAQKNADPRIAEALARSKGGSSSTAKKNAGLRS